MTQTITLAGGTGNLGQRVAKALVARGSMVRALVRSGAKADTVAALTAIGVEVRIVDFSDVAALVEACRGTAAVVSTLSGLRPVIVETQGRLLDAAVIAGVPRFIPSDFSIDYQPLSTGSNRNFDLRREFRATLDTAPIRATSIFNGAFADMLTGQAPVIIKPIRRVVYWNAATVPLDFTTMDDTAAYTAAVAMDDAAPRDLHIAGERTTAQGLAETMNALTGHRFRPFRAGGIMRLRSIIAIVRAVFPQKDDVFPVWQGMQYLDSMFSGEAGAPPLDNDRYGEMRWTDIRGVMEKA